ncbi:hypothetical protein [Nitrososphaera sp.]|uniref:hypothetical protein n=1 Tax=Nitrososphaera sp. TaxID=1971748 RepID=UPI003172A159
MMIFRLPALADLKKAGHQERMNLYRRYFASSRYNRLLIQQTLVKSAADPGLAKEVERMEQEHNRDFAETVGRIKEYGYLDEFLDAVKEEDDALQKVIEAYDKRMRAGR